MLACSHLVWVQLPSERLGYVYILTPIRPIYLPVVKRYTCSLGSRHIALAHGGGRPTDPSTRQNTPISHHFGRCSFARMCPDVCVCVRLLNDTSVYTEWLLKYH